MPDVAMVLYTEEVARELAATFSGAPLDELRVWVRLAHQREAMVTQLYDPAHLDDRLRALDGAEPAAVIRSAVNSIWAHEESHTRFLASLRSLSQKLPELDEARGKIEGRITRSAVGGGTLARMLIALGVSLGQAPGFAGELQAMSLRQLIEFDGELETTARLGYERILQLAGALDGDGTLSDEFGYAFAYDVARIHSEECFHEAAFQTMSSWVGADGHAASVSASECAQALHALCDRHLRLTTVRDQLQSQFAAHGGTLRSPASTGGGEIERQWLSDGGLGAVFSQFALPIPLANPDAAMLQLWG